VPKRAESLAENVDELSPIAGERDAQAQVNHVGDLWLRLNGYRHCAQFTPSALTPPIDPPSSYASEYGLLQMPC